MFDVVMAAVFAVVGWRSCAELLRQREILREFGLSLILVPILLLYPVAHLVAFGLGWISSTPLVRGVTWTLCAALYFAAWRISRYQSESLYKAGTSRTQLAQDAISTGQGFAMLGFALVVARVIVFYIVSSIHGD